MWGKTPDEQYRNSLILAGVAAALLVVGLIIFFSSGQLVIFQQMWFVVRKLWWLIFPVPMWIIFDSVWSEYRELMWVIKQKSVLLEIKPPADTEKSPKIMEHIITSLHDYSTLSEFEIYCGWKVFQAKYSFEVASLEGVVHYYIRCPVGLKNHIEAQIYSQYPDAEIFEVEDYVYKVPKNLPNAEWNVWGTTLAPNKPEAYPIRIYTQFQEEVTGKMVDPMAGITEVFSSFTKGEYGWLQFVFDSATGKTWVPQAEAELDKIAKKAKPAQMGVLESFFSNFGILVGNIFRGFFGGEMKTLEQPKSEEFSLFKMTPKEQDAFKAINDKISYNGYNTVIRYVYIAKREVFRKGLGVASLLGAMKQVNDTNLNSYLADSTTKTFAHYFFTETRTQYRQRKIVNDYRGRDFAGLRKVLTAPELATFYHFPDMSVKAANIQRVEAKKGEAPFNLPIEED